jgi:hypothetical protein
MQRIRFSALLVTLALPAFSLTLAGCGSGGPPAASMSAAGSQEGQSAGESRTGSRVAEVVQVRADGPSNDTPARPAIIPAARPEVVIDTSLGKIRLRLFPEQSPNTVDNFLANYVDRGFYDNTIIHFAARVSSSPPGIWHGFRTRRTAGLYRERGGQRAEKRPRDGGDEPRPRTHRQRELPVLHQLGR